jgi:hypothetical protein
VGLNRGTTDVTLSGTLAVLGTMHFYRVPEMLLNLAGFLEGRLIAHLEGGENEETGH